ncbi:uncharacterized protein LOC114558401 [Perca flavescens]|nr:uncharacterized protein LOC114558401 [Perca flavescens]
MPSAVNISPPAHPGPNGGSLHTHANSRGPTCEQQDTGLHGISQDPGPSIHPPVFVRPFFYVHPPPPPPLPPPPPFLHYQWPMPFPYNPFATFPGMGYGMVMPPFPPHPYMDAPPHILYHPHVQPVDRRFLHPQVYAPSAPYQNPNRTHRINPPHTGNVRETVNCEVQTEPIQRGRYGERSPLIGSDSGRGTGSNSPSAEVRSNTLPSSNSLMSVSSPDSIVPVCSSFQQEEVVKERCVSVPDILMSWRGGTPQAKILKMALPQNDKHPLAYKTEEEHKSFYQSPTQTKNGLVAADSTNDNAERNLSSKNSATLFQILKLKKAHGERKAECRRENEPVGLIGSLKRSLPYTEKLLHSHNKSRKLPNNEQEDDETNPHEDTTEIIPYQMNSCRTERKMNESVWSVASLPPFVPTKEWLLQNGMLEPEVTDPVPMSKTLPQNDQQLLSYATEEDHDRSFYQSPTQTKNGPVVADGAYGNAEDTLSSMDISTLYTIFKLRDDHEERNAESRNAVRCSLPYTDELLHSQKDSQKLPYNEQEDGDETNPHATTTEIIPYQMSLNSTPMERKMNESVWSVKYLPPIPTKEWLLQNGMLEPEVNDCVQVSKTLPQNDHQLPSYEAEDHEKSSYQSPTPTITGPVVPDGANHNAKGNLSSKDSATLFQILKLRKAHEEQNAESTRENESLEFIGSVRRDELLHSQNQSQKLPDNELDQDETNPHEDTTKIITYQMSLNSSPMERKMNELVWSVKSLPPFIPSKDWLLQNGMLKPKVNDSVPVSNMPHQNDHQLPSYETEDDENSFYQSPTRTKNGPVVADGANPNAKGNLRSEDSATLFTILKLRKAHEEQNAESTRENELVEFIGSVRRDKLLRSQNQSQKLPDNELVHDETNPHENTTEIIPYQISLISSQMERKMNESVKSLPPFILTNGILEPKVTDFGPMSKTLPQNDHQLLSYETDEQKSFYQSTTWNKNGPVMADGEYVNDVAEGNLSSTDSVTLFQILKLIDAHKGHNAECRRENEPMGLVGSGRRSLPYADEWLHSQKESQKLPYNEQDDGNETNPQADMTEIIPNQMYSCQTEREMNESVWSVEFLPPFIPTKEWLLQNSMLEPEVTVPMSKTPPQNDHQLPCYLAEEEHEKSFYRSPTPTITGPVVPDGANHNAKGNLSSKDSATLFQILKLRKAHEEQNAESTRENESLEFIGSVRRDELLRSRNQSQKLPDNELVQDEPNPRKDTTEIIPYQMSLNSSPMERKMNDSVWSVESLPPFVPTKEWLLQNGMLEPEVNDCVQVSKTPPQNDHQLPSYEAEDHEKSFYQSPTQTKTGPVVPDGVNRNAKGNLSSKNSPDFFKHREAEEQKAKSRRENEPVGLVDCVRRTLFYTDELLHSRKESQKIPDYEQEDGDKTNPHEDTTPYQIKKINESVWSVEYFAPFIPSKECLLQNGMLEPEVTDSVPTLPSYEAEEEHVKSFSQSPTLNKNGPVMADAAYANDANGNAEGNLSSMDIATLFKIFKLRKAHEEQNAESVRAVRHSLPYIDELLHSQNKSRKLPDNEQEDGDETNPQADTTEIIPYQMCSSQMEREIKESVESLAPSIPTKCSEMDGSKIWRLKQGQSMVPLVKSPLASPTPQQSKQIVSTLTEEDADTNRCPLIHLSGADMEVEDGACRNKEVQNQQLCVQTADQNIADVSPSKAHLVDCGVQCTELQEHKCVCEMKSSMGPSRWHPSKHLDKKANHGPAEGGKRKKRRGGMVTGGMSSDMHSSQQEAYNGGFGKPWKSQDMHSSQQEAYNGNFCRPWKSQGRYGRNRR